MNIFRLQRKSKGKIKLKKLVLFIFSLTMTTFAWFAYSKVLNPRLNIHMASWDMQYFIGETEKENPIGISIPTLYPTMEEQSVKIDIKNNGERLVDIQYDIKSLSIIGVQYELVQEGQTPTSDNYVVIVPPTLEKIEEPEAELTPGAELTPDAELTPEEPVVTETEPTPVVSGTEQEDTSKYLYRGIITNNMTQFPFTIEIEHSAQVEPYSKQLAAPGEGYLTVRVNWIGDSDELDSEWGYKVGEYLTANPTATSVISMEISIDSYQAEGPIQEYTETLPSGYATQPYMPEGFSRVPGTNLETGLVIKDSSGNEFVWVEVPKVASIYSADGLDYDLDTLTGTELTDAYTAIETKLNEYTQEYGTRADAYTDQRYLGISIDTYNDLERKMLKSIYKNGGFYIGRYETGIEKTYRTEGGSIEETHIPVIKANAYPFNYVTCSQAQSLANSMSSGGYTTSLMFGLQWDLVLKYLQTKNTLIADEIITDSSTWGNYSTSTYDLINPKSKYLLSTESDWKTPIYYKSNTEQTLLTTGANSGFSRKNIYDIAGNLSEWTFNTGFNNSNVVGGNGGNFTADSAKTANNCGLYNTLNSYKHVGFRVALYDDSIEGNLEGKIDNITQITLDKTEEEIAVGETFSLTATMNEDAQENVIWTSSNPDVAIVVENEEVALLNEYDIESSVRIASLEPNIENLLNIASAGKTKTVTIRAVGPGTATITAKNSNGSVFHSCTVTVLMGDADNILPSTSETTPYLPTGFSKVNGTDLTNGLTIQDGFGNQYVWVEVPRNTTIYNDAGLDIDLDSLSGTDLTNAYTAIETDLEDYTGRDANDIYSGDDTTTGLSSTAYTDLKNKMLKSVYENGGFYVGKYETGTKGTYRDYGTDFTTEHPIEETPVIQANAYPYGFVTVS